MGLFLGSLYSSIDLCIHFYASTIIVLIIIALYHSLKSECVILAAMFVSVKIALAIWSVLWFIQILELFIQFCENVMDILTGIALNLWISLSNMDILTILILIIHDSRFLSFSLAYLKFPLSMHYSFQSRSFTLLTWFLGFF